MPDHELIERLSSRFNVFAERECLIDELGKRRNLHYLAAEWYTVFDRDYDQQGVIVEVNRYEGSEKRRAIRAVVDGHGKWIEWEPIT